MPAQKPRPKTAPAPAAPADTSLKGRLLSAWEFAKDLFGEFSDDNCFRLAAALSYYTIFSIAPILIIVIATAGAIFGQDAISGEVFNQAKDLVGIESAKTIEGLVQQAYLAKSGFLTTVIAVVTLFISATTTFAVIQDSLNTIWKIRVKPERGILKWAVTRGLSFGLVLAIGFLMIVSLIVNAVLVALSDYFTEQINLKVIDEASVYLLDIGQQAASLAVLTLLFALMFKYLPDVIVPWRKVWVASLLTAVLFTLGKGLIGFYLGKSNPASAYGGAASVIILMLWVNYSAWIFFLGAEFIYVSMRRSGDRIVPSRFAVRLHMEVLEEEGVGKAEPSRHGGK